MVAAAYDASRVNGYSSSCSSICQRYHSLAVYKQRRRGRTRLVQHVWVMEPSIISSSFEHRCIPPRQGTILTPPGAYAAVLIDMYADAAIPNAGETWRETGFLRVAYTSRRTPGTRPLHVKLKARMPPDIPRCVPRPTCGRMFSRVSNTSVIA